MLPRPSYLFPHCAVLVGALLIGHAAGQDQTATEPPPSVSARQSASIQVKDVSIERTGDDVAVAISSDGALVPAITKLNGPPRLVIDLAGAVTTIRRGRAKEPTEDVKGVRVSQYQQRPPLTRVVVDLSEPRDYAWETVQNKLVIHLRKPSEAATEDEPEVDGSAPAFTTGTEAAVRGAGNANVVFTGAEESGPSAVSAAADTVVVDLARGGQIRVCPGTTVSLTASRNARDVMVGMNTGSVEAHYSLAKSADSILTPDFRILLSGPGRFDLAVSADSRGTTCVRALPGNTASAVVSELMSDGMYHVKADEQVVFHGGQLTKADHDVPIDCGCPAVENPILRTEAPSSTPAQVASAPPPTSTNSEQQIVALLAAPPEASLSGTIPGSAQVSIAVTNTPRATGSVERAAHVQFDAPLVFRGNEPLPAPVEQAAKLPVVSLAPQGPLMVVPLPPPLATEPVQNATPSKPRTGFFGHIKRFFVSVFG